MKGQVDVLLGAQWGDEGKGKVVDVIAPDYRVIARFQGGPNAGHTLIIDGRKHVLHTIPSGIFRDGTMNLIGNGVVIDPVVLMREVDMLTAAGVDVPTRLLVSRRAHLILPTHRSLDAASEADKGKDRIGSTLKGIGPTYMDKTGRNGFRVGDLETDDRKERYAGLVKKHERLLALYKNVQDHRAQEEEWLDASARLSELQLVDSEYWLDERLRAGDNVLAEGAQGTLLDIDFGTYPFVTSSNTISAGASTGLGIAPSRIRRVMGVFKAYCTRVGSGPFPTELHDAVGEHLRTNGKEFGSTTGRPRRCGWLDLPALRYAVMINGITDLAMMKADVLSCMDEVLVCTHYRIGQQTFDHLPFGKESMAEPVYRSLPGWGALDANNGLPSTLENYIRIVEEAVGAQVTIVSTGPDRKETLSRKSTLAHV